MSSKQLATLFLLFFCISCRISLPAAAQSIQRRPWYESSIDSNEITFAWTTSNAGPSELRAGITGKYELPTVDGGSGTNHVANLTELSNATTYFIQIVTSLDTVSFYSSTASDYRSSDSIQVYFNRGTDTSLRRILPPSYGNQDYRALLEQRILGAKASIDLAVYSYSGAIADSVNAWLLAATERGIKVRFIADSTSVWNSPQYHALRASRIPVIINSFGKNGDVASNIHHNKFIVIDGRVNDGSTAWLLGGSWNLTDEQTTEDYQDVIQIQDLSLVRAYEREFNQEWGSSGDEPNADSSKFSTNKSDITPRSFNLHGTTAHLFFSPNGGAFDGINSVLSSARRQILFALFVFTRQDLAQTLITEHTAGIDVHGIVDETDKYEQTPTLRASGIDAITFALGDSILFHHKYAIVDAGTPEAAVITGSYNWSLSAETVNNENSLIIQSDSISEEYFEEWRQRYLENGGNESVKIPELGVAAPPPTSGGLYPNPSRGTFAIDWQQSASGKVRVEMYNSLGQRISDRYLRAFAGNMHLSFEPFHESGVYTVVIDHDHVRERRKLIAVH